MIGNGGKPGLLAMYLRISKDDGTSLESGSISHQRDLLRDYTASSPDLASMEVIELVDDGYSGTSMDRPAMEKLLGMIHQGQVRCILVKDFSRFSRDHLACGQHIFQLFPQLGVRFISLGDGYDSSQATGSAGFLDMSLRHLVYDYYSKDLSKKVKSARAAAMRSGTFTGASAPYGYRKSNQRRGCLEPDPGAAPVVVRIFSLCSAGEGTAAIACRLNGEGISTPLAYKRGGVRVGTPSPIWTKDTVNRILRDERYTGMLVGGKRERLLGKGRTRKVPLAQWVTVFNTHQALVTHEIFRQAQERLGAFRQREKGAIAPSLFVRKIFCGSCQRVMLRKSGCYRCPGSLYSPDYSCSASFLPERIILDVLRRVLEAYRCLFLSREKLLEAVRHRALRRIAGIEAQRERLVLKAASFSHQNVVLYEEFKDGHLDMVSYKHQLSERRELKARLEEEAAALDHALSHLAHCQSVIPPLEDEALAEALHKWIVLDQNTMEVTFSFADPFTRM